MKYKNKNKEKYISERTLVEKSIENRPKEANDRSEYGHWEGDLVVGKNNKGSALFVMTERKYREELIVKVPDKKKATIAKALDMIMKKEW